jgi:hypothetical protein
MGTIAERRVFGLLALAQMSRLGFLGREDVRDEISPLVGSVAKRLRVRKAARAERVLLALFELDRLRLGRCNFWLIHLK